jgi:protein-L-isoaspartate(D-aspartate) O-methyltransferase
MSKMVSGCGKVIGIDHIKPLVEKSKENVRKNFAYLLHKIKFITSDGRNGYSSEAPYDVINIGGGVTEVPQTILDQLKIGGRIIAPIQGTNVNIQDLVTIDKLKDGSILRKRRKRVFFEPLKSLV